MNNLLIVKGISPEIFFQNRNKKDWVILDLKEFVKSLKDLRKRHFQQIAIGYQDLKEKNFKYFIELILLVLKSSKKYFIDNQGNVEYFSFWRFIFIDTSLFIGELFFDLLLIIFSWTTLFIIYFLPKRKFKILFRSTYNNELKRIIYLRTDNFRGLQEGGSFTHFRGVVRGFDKLGYKIHYIGSGDIQMPGLSFPKTIISYPLRFNLPEISEIYYNWRFIPRAYGAIKKSKPLFIYQRHSIFNVCGSILSQLTGIPLILEYNGSEPWIRQKWGGLLIFKQLCRFMENYSLKKAKIIAVVSNPMKEELLKHGISRGKILVNYNGVNPEVFNSDLNGLKIRRKYDLENKIVIGAVSTFGAWHGMPVLSKAVKSIIDKTRNTKHKIHFLFVGEGVQRPECERIIQKSDMNDYVTFTGTVPYQEIAQYLAACDILVSPHVPNVDSTPFFGSPTKLFEYMAIGKGIVASDLDQIGEVLEHEKTAWLVKPGDVNDLVNGIIKLIQDKELRENLGENARAEVLQRYSWEQNAQRIINMYKRNFGA